MLLDFDRLGALRWVLVGIGVVIAVYLILPIVFIVLLSFGSSRWLAFPPPYWTVRWYQEFFADDQWLTSIFVSLRVAVVVTVLSTLLGLMAALGIVRGQFPGRSLVRAFLLTPMVLPVVVLAVGLYALTLRAGINGTFLGLVAAHMVIALPFSVIAISNSLVSFDKSIEDAAVLCGASPLWAMWKVTLPAIRSGVAAAAIFSFLASWDEVVLAIFMSSPRLQTFPVRIWTTLQQDLTPVAAAASSLIIGLTTVLLLVGFLFALRRRL
ncbi:putative spermidine/putrescine transport system permease protein [Rhodoligotrophos appendicifer]|uniref:ABC transporter permease n=1 Tax=Rhodoligotrophos appendicifer TaxID=987056 RepID=UPI0011855DDD|nr:ABC transporter permease [Rhodoligotrophos appendicifer]